MQYDKNQVQMQLFGEYGDLRAEMNGLEDRGFRYPIREVIDLRCEFRMLSLLEIIVGKIRPALCQIVW